MLNVKNVNVYYGGIHALKGVDIVVNKGEIVSIIGSNGAGKSTLLNTISGIIKPKEGEITYKDEKLNLSPHKIVAKGICQVPEGRLVFANLTVKDNLLLGAYLRKDKKEIEEDLQKVFDIFPRLLEREKQFAGTLSGGEQQMLAIGRALMGRPEIVLLDEPSLGLAPLLVDTIFNIILDLKRMGNTILLVEQNAFKALQISDRAYVLEQGKITLEGDAKEIASNPKVQEAYLGKKIS
ncbi:High-affinity branched-chain amino acid transport ATP-binding protein LivF [Caloramator mitchellensis]|uniref:High-affinity branched-chain amino acid transport ATP-binding protein LivF n=1 Tax=Caloramator mitchellensis TaxID=908809 RepID=A0A0R3JV33_CALMK|nr:ABC transporter ATP-binding protein [Caloramator mitchellensis]KRQ87451.1 High-affinity branched-chain amino acid transport ATP-binding protein LivF [Caloramator mitchellensis]